MLLEHVPQRYGIPRLDEINRRRERGQLAAQAGADQRVIVSEQDLHRAAPGTVISRTFHAKFITTARSFGRRNGLVQQRITGITGRALCLRSRVAGNQDTGYPCSRQRRPFAAADRCRSRRSPSHMSHSTRTGLVGVVGERGLREHAHWSPSSPSQPNSSSSARLPASTNGSSSTTNTRKTRSDFPNAVCVVSTDGRTVAGFTARQAQREYGTVPRCRTDHRPCSRAIARAAIRSPVRAPGP